MNQERMARREVLRGLAGCTAGIVAAEMTPGAAQAAELNRFPSNSGLISGKPKPLPYAEIPGFLSKAQLSQHHETHYEAAVSAFHGHDQQLTRVLQGSGAVSSPSYSFLVKDRINRANSVVLHELYFDNVAAEKSPPKEDLRAALGKRFGSLDRWADDFRAACLAANGWGILARDAANGQLYNVASDLHEVGALWFGQPLVVCDVYEHAYYIDYQSRKSDYVGKFLEHLLWNEVNRRWQASP